MIDHYELEYRRRCEQAAFMGWVRLRWFMLGVMGGLTLAWYLP